MGWQEILALSDSKEVIPGSKHRHLATMACPATVYAMLRYSNPMYTNAIEAGLPNRTLILEELKKVGSSDATLHLSVRDMADLLSPGGFQAPFMDIFMGYTMPFLGKNVTFMAFNSLIKLIPGKDDLPLSESDNFRPTIKPANIIAGVAARFIDGHHFMPIIVAWKEKKVFYIDPYGDPDAGKRFLTDEHMDGIRTFLAWISRVKQQKPDSAQNFQFVSVGLPEQFRQTAAHHDCMAFSCAITFLFCRFFASQMMSSDGGSVHLPVASEGDSAYDFSQVCLGLPMMMTKHQVAAFHSGILSLIVNSIEAKEFFDNDPGLSDGTHMQPFLSSNIEDQLAQMRAATHDKYPTDYTGNLVFEPSTPLDILTVHKTLQDKGYDKSEEHVKHMTTGRLMLLLLLSHTFPKTEPTPPKLTIICNAVTDEPLGSVHPSTYGTCPPVPFTVEPMGAVGEKHFKRCP
jgi:hypothetical protein